MQRSEISPRQADPTHKLMGVVNILAEYSAQVLLVERWFERWLDNVPSMYVTAERPQNHASKGAAFPKAAP